MCLVVVFLFVGRFSTVSVSVNVFVVLGRFAFAVGGWIIERGSRAT